MSKGLGFERPKKAATIEKDAAKLSGKEKRLVADVPEEIHRQVRMRCLERGILVRDYLLELLARDGIT